MNQSLLLKADAAWIILLTVVHIYKRRNAPENKMVPSVSWLLIIHSPPAHCPIAEFYAYPDMCLHNFRIYSWRSSDPSCHLPVHLTVHLLPTHHLTIISSWILLSTPSLFLFLFLGQMRKSVPLESFFLMYSSLANIFWCSHFIGKVKSRPRTTGLPFVLSWLDVFA